MELVIIPVVAFVAAILAFYSGFGLGTLLTPALVFFFPVELAVGLTAVVHFLNNVHKLVLVGKHADRPILLRFGLPAILAAFVGAEVLVWLSGGRPLATYAIGGHEFQVVPVKLVVAVVIAAITILEVLPRFRNLQAGRRHLVLGGVLSGFFGGLSGHQGAFRSAFLAKAGLGKEVFIATGVAIACLIDLSRLIVYAGQISRIRLATHGVLLVSATVAASLGVFLGNRFLSKITMTSIQRIVTVMLLAVAAGLGAGLF